jgi:hypothetical protein
MKVSLVTVALYAAFWACHEGDVVPTARLSRQCGLARNCLAAIADDAFGQRLAGHFLAVHVDGVALGPWVAVSTCSKSDAARSDTARVIFVTNASAVVACAFCDALKERSACQYWHCWFQKVQLLVPGQQQPPAASTAAAAKVKGKSFSEAG